MPLGGWGDRRPARGAALAWVGHPVTLGATVVLAVNDRLLKPALPGLLTGKLSDVAGLMAAPPLLALLLTLVGFGPADRVAVAALGLTGAGFAVAKSSAAGAGRASQAWSAVLPSRVVGDRTDLFALPALGVCWWVGARVRRGQGRGRSADAVRRIRVLVAVPLAVLATVASADDGRPYSDALVGTKDGAVLVVRFGGPGVGPGGQVLESAGPGATWQQAREDITGPSAYVPGMTVRTRACAPARPALCYRIVPGQARVEQTADGGAHWSTAWRLSAGRQLYLRRNGDFGVPAAAGSLRFDATSLVVVPGAAGCTVIVADRNGGLAVRDPTGHWSRRGAGLTGPTALGPIPVTGLAEGLTMEYLLAFTAAWLAVLVGAGAARVRRRPDRRTRRAVAVRIVCGLAWLPALDALGGHDGDPSVLRTCVLVTVDVIVLFGLSVGRGPRVRSRALAWSPAGAAVGTGTLTLLPFLGWTVARPDSYAVACVLSLLLLLGSLGGAWTLGRRAASARPATPATPD